MNILIVGRSEPDWCPDRWLAQAFCELGHQIEFYDCWKRMFTVGTPEMEEVLIDLVKSSNFKLVLLTRGFLSPTCIKELGCHTHTHFRYIDPEAERVKVLAAYCHSASASATDIASDLGASFIPDGCFPAVHFPGKVRAEFKADVSMIGRAYDVRVRIVTDLRRRGIEVKTYGDKAWPPPAFCEKVYGSEFRDIVASSAINLATNLYHLIPGWTSIRVFLLLACGGFTLINAFPGIEEFFQNGKHLVWYESEEEVPELIAYWLNKPEQRHIIAENGRQLVVNRFTMKHTTKQILKVCNL